MQTFQQLVIDEKRELDDRLAKLTAFFDAETFATLPQSEKKRLARQASAMHLYSDILQQRISAFS